MWQRLYRRARRFASPVHPNRIRARVKAFFDRRGWTPRYHFVIASIENFLRRNDPRRHAALHAATWRFVRDLVRTIRRRRRDPRLSVAVDVTAFWEPLTGIGWYLYRLLEHLAHEPGLVLRLYGPDLVDTPDLPPMVVEPPAGPSIERVRYRVPEGMSISYVRMVGWLRDATERLIAVDGNRLLFAPNYFLPKSFRRARGKLVATVHDLGFERVPWTLRDETRRDLETHLRRTLERAERILTDSETVRGELLATGWIAPERVAAIHLGPGPLAGVEAAQDEPPGLPERFVLHVGTLEPRKNLPVLLAAWRRWRESGEAPPPLVFCGRYGWKTEELEREIETAVGEGWLLTYGYLDNAHVATLYRRALYVVLPSIYEGFGLPAVEAMSAGVPLVLSDLPVLREIAGEAALYVPPSDVDAWAETCRALACDGERRAELTALGRLRSQRYDWRRTAATTAAVWHEVAGRRVPMVARAEEVAA